MTGQDTEQLRREIERTRAELGATVEQLSQKADLKAQARERAELAKRQARERAGLARQQARERVELVRSRAQERPGVPLALGIGAAVVALWMLRRRRRA